MKIQDQIIKVIAVDVDGTLTTPDGSISEATKTALITAQKQGIRLAIVTGRMKEETLDLIEQLKMKEFQGFFLGNNGQIIESCYEEQRTIKGTVEMADALEALRIARKMRLLVVFHYEYSVYLSCVKPLFLSKIMTYFQKQNWIFNQIKAFKWKIIDNPEKLIKQNLSKLCFIGSYRKLSKLKERLIQSLSTKHAIVFVTHSWMEIMHQEVSKGNALKELSQQLNIPLEQFLAFGDGENDLSMIETAGMSVAMGNAMPLVKKEADYICKSNTEDGIAQFLNDYL